MCHKLNFFIAEFLSVNENCVNIDFEFLLILEFLLIINLLCQMAISSSSSSTNFIATQVLQNFRAAGVECILKIGNGMDTLNSSAVVES